MAEPTLIEYDESPFNQTWTTDRVSGSITWQTGDLILVLGGISNNNGTSTYSTPTATGLTFSLVTSVNVNADGNDCVLYLWSATAGGNGSSAVTAVTNSSETALRGGISVFVFRGSDGLGTPVTLDGQNAITISLARVQANSHVVMMLADWAQPGDVTVTATPTGTMRHASAESGQADFFTISFADQGATGTTSYGILQSSKDAATEDMSGIVVEVKGTATTTKAPTPFHRSQRFFRRAS